MIITIEIPDDYMSLAIRDVLEKIEELINLKSTVSTPEQLEELEKEIVQTTDELASAVTALKLQKYLDSAELKDKASDLIDHYPRKMKNQGRRKVKVRALRGPDFEIYTTYYSRKGKKKGGKRRGLYPVLISIGNQIIALLP